MDEPCQEIKNGEPLAIAILSSASIDTILFFQFSIYTYKYMKRFGKLRDPYFLTTVIFILLQLLIRIITNIDVAM